MTSDQSQLTTRRNYPKISRDPVTGYATVEILGREIVLQKDVKADEIFDKPAQEVVECAL